MPDALHRYDVCTPMLGICPFICLVSLATRTRKSDSQPDDVRDTQHGEARATSSRAETAKQSGDTLTTADARTTAE